MPMIRGKGILALWNGVDPARQPEYDLWHTREHVPERLSVPGMIGARRYVLTTGLLPRYLTLYDLDDITVLSSEPYQRLLSEPTAWSRSMRPSFRGFMRLCCVRAFSAGGGTGGVLGAAMLDEAAAADIDALRDALTQALAEPGVVAAHLILRDPKVPDVPFTIGGEAPVFPRAGAVLLEGYDEKCLSAAADALTGLLPDPGTGSAIHALSIYRLVYAVEREELASLVPFSGGPLSL